MHHTFPEPLNAPDNLALNPESFARWSRDTPRKCVVFVHGFLGNAVRTWGEFKNYASKEAAFADADLIFLGYESMASAHFSAGVIYQVLELLAEDSSRAVADFNGPERGQFSYERIVLIAHSLGGPIIRDAAMAAVQQGKSWADKIELGLFAPAHSGARIFELTKALYSLIPWGGVITSGMRTKMPVLDDLAIGSAYLSSLLKRATEIGPHNSTVAKFVVHVANDKIVETQPFYKDPPITPAPKSTHMGCCKPTEPKFMIPVTSVKKMLTNA